MSRILSEIWIYPVKSLGGIRLTDARVKPKGLEHDRRWMLVDENDVFMTQRDYPAMALFRLQLKGDGFRIVHDDNSIILPFRSSGGTVVVQSEVWGSPVSTIEVSREHSQWFSKELGIVCKLVSFPEQNPRPVNPVFAPHQEHVSLADGYPLLIVGQASLDDLNTRLIDPVMMNRFRPNLVFTGGDPYEEDGWKEFSVGKNRFAGVKPCIRCAVTTINQDTGEKGLEPLTTLSGYRRSDGGVRFGQNVLAIDNHEIHEGDEISFE